MAGRESRTTWLSARQRSYIFYAILSSQVGDRPSASGRFNSYSNRSQSIRCRYSGFHVEAIDLLSNRVTCEAGIALVVAVYSAIKKHSVQPGLLILGDLSIQGNIKSVRSLAEPLQVGMDNGARRALIPLENKRNFLEVSGDIVERVDPVFFSDPMTAAMKALGMN